MVDGVWLSDLIKGGQRAEQGIKGTARVVGKDCIVAAKT